jgi:hypothetical protein
MEDFRSQVFDKDLPSLVATVGEYTFARSKERIVDHMLERHFGINWEYFYYRDDTKIFARSIFSSGELDTAVKGMVGIAYQLAKEAAIHQLFTESYLQQLAASIDCVHSKIDAFLKKPRKNESAVRDASRLCPEIFQCIGESTKHLHQSLSICGKINTGDFRVAIDDINGILVATEAIVVKGLLPWITNFSQTANSILSATVPFDASGLPDIEVIKSSLAMLGKIKENLSKNLSLYKAVIGEKKELSILAYGDCIKNPTIKEVAEKFFIHSLSNSVKSVETSESSGIISMVPKSITLSDKKSIAVSCLAPTAVEVNFELMITLLHLTKSY